MTEKNVREKGKLPRRISHQSKPTITRLILEKIAEAGEVMLDSFFPAKYPEARLWRKMLGLDASYEFRRASFSALLWKLKAQGLVAKMTYNHRASWRLTRRGNDALGERRPEALPSPDGKMRLICFDIPERERAKRRWLRGELIAFGYRQLQRSVWIGDRPLPQDFMQNLDILALRNRVHIVAVASRGTLDEL